MYGYTYRQMIAYTFMAGLITRIVRTGFEYEIMDDVKSGKYSKFMVQPVGYFPYRLASFFGNKLPGLVDDPGHPGRAPGRSQRVLGPHLPVSLASWPSWSPCSWRSCSTSSSFTASAPSSFWIVEVGFLFEGIRIVTVLLSGGIFPLEVFGERFVQVMNLLPFKYTVNYPINVLNGKVTAGRDSPGPGASSACGSGLACLLANLLWRVGSRRYVAVGG